MNPITLLTNTVNDLWFWTYGLVAGWGMTFTLLVVAVIFLALRHIKLTKQHIRLEHRLISLEREFNQENKTWPGKK